MLKRLNNITLQMVLPTLCKMRQTSAFQVVCFLSLLKGHSYFISQLYRFWICIRRWEDWVLDNIRNANWSNIYYKYVFKYEGLVGINPTHQCQLLCFISNVDRTLIVTWSMLINHIVKTFSFELQTTSRRTWIISY